MLECYEIAIRNTIFSGPTYFSHILKEIKNTAIDLKFNYPDEYLILFILTDGEINDQELSKELIIDMCELPVSIIIVGVGNANFNLMIELDGVFFNFKG
jgi:hypothetical protein